MKDLFSRDELWNYFALPLRKECKTVGIFVMFDVHAHKHYFYQNLSVGPCSRRFTWGLGQANSDAKGSEGTQLI